MPFRRSKAKEQELASLDHLRAAVVRKEQTLNSAKEKLVYHDTVISMAQQSLRDALYRENAPPGVWHQLERLTNC